MKHYYTKDKNGNDVEVSHDDALALINMGKRTANDFQVEDDNQQPTKNATPSPEVQKANYDQMTSDIASARQNAEVNQNPVLAPIGLGLSQTFAPNSYKETMQGLNGFNVTSPGTEADFANALQTVAPAMAPVAGIPSAIGRVAAMGGVGLESYLLGNAINPLSKGPTLSGAGISTLGGLVGQGLGESLAAGGGALLSKELGLAPGEVSNLMSSQNIGSFTTKQGIINNIQKSIDDLSNNRDAILQEMQTGTIDINEIRQNIMNNLKNASDAGYIDPLKYNAQTNKTEKEITAIQDLFNAIQMEKDPALSQIGIVPGVTPSYAFNRSQALLKGIKGQGGSTPQSVQDVVSTTRIPDFVRGQGIQQSLYNNVPGVQQTTNSINELNNYLTSINKAPTPYTALLDPRKLLPSSTLYNLGKAVGTGGATDANTLGTVGAGATVPLSSLMGLDNNQ